MREAGWLKINIKMCRVDTFPGQFIELKKNLSARK